MWKRLVLAGRLCYIGGRATGGSKSRGEVIGDHDAPKIWSAWDWDRGRYARRAAVVVLANCSNAFATVKSTAVLEEVANCMPALKLFVVKCYV